MRLGVEWSRNDFPAPNIVEGVSYNHLNEILTFGLFHLFHYLFGSFWVSHRDYNESTPNVADDKEFLSALSPDNLLALLASYCLFTRCVEGATTFYTLFLHLLWHGYYKLKGFRRVCIQHLLCSPRQQNNK